jgi:hypothetical protein
MNFFCKAERLSKVEGKSRIGESRSDLFRGTKELFIQLRSMAFACSGQAEQPRLRDLQRLIVVVSMAAPTHAMATALSSFWSTPEGDYCRDCELKPVVASVLRLMSRDPHVGGFWAQLVLSSSRPYLPLSTLGGSWPSRFHEPSGPLSGRHERVMIPQ